MTVVQSPRSEKTHVGDPSERRLPLQAPVVRLKLTGATCKHPHTSSTSHARRAEIENRSEDSGPGQDADVGVGGWSIGVGGSSLHPAFRLFCIPTARPRVLTTRVEGKCHCFLSWSFCLFGQRHFFLPLRGRWERPGTRAGRRAAPHTEAHCLAPFAQVI